MIDAILFDLDNTLTLRSRSIEHYTERLAADFANQLVSAVDPRWLARQIIGVDAGGYGGHPKRCAMLQALPIWQQVPCQDALLAHWFAHFPHNPSPMAGLHDTLSKLKQAGFTLGLVSNGRGEVQRAKLAALSIEPYFAAISLSGEVGCKKPSPAIFVHALAQLGCRAEQVLFVGDHPVNDYAGAKAAGLLPVWFEGFIDWPREQAPARHRISDLPAIVELALTLRDK